MACQFFDKSLQVCWPANICLEHVQLPCPKSADRQALRFEMHDCSVVDSGNNCDDDSDSKDDNNNNNVMTLSAGWQSDLWLCQSTSAAKTASHQVLVICVSDLVGHWQFHGLLRSTHIAQLCVTTGKKDHFSAMHAFGCRAWVHPPGGSHTKFILNSRKGIFLVFILNTDENILLCDSETAPR